LPRSTFQNALVAPAQPSVRAAGEYPIADFGSRIRTGCGLMENRSGESITWVSPSSPISIGDADETSNVGVDHEVSPS
jgi:hypothetical protein